MRSLLFRLVVMGVVSWALAGCVRAPRFTPGVPLAADDSQALCSALNAASEHLFSFRSMLDATVEGPGGESVSFRYAIVGKSNEKLRIDILPHEGAYTLALITVQGSKALFLDPQAKRVTEGCSVKEVLEKFLGLQGMTPAAVQALVLGRPPVLECQRIAAHRSAAGGVVFVDLMEQVAWEVDEGSGALRKAHFLDSRGATVTAVAVREEAGMIVVSVYKPVGATAEMRIVKLTKNPDVTDSTFDVAVPSGYEREGC
jgi:hypothetical protein